jgi:hypothetical protein
MTLLYMALALVAVGTGYWVYLARTAPPAPDPLTDEIIVKTAVERDFVLALKWYRELHGESLRVAKPALEKLVAEYQARKGGSDVAVGRQ